MHQLSDASTATAAATPKMPSSISLVNMREPKRPTPIQNIAMMIGETILRT